MNRSYSSLSLLLLFCVTTIAAATDDRPEIERFARSSSHHDLRNFYSAVGQILQGQEIFRFDAFGDETFWGDSLRLHEVIAGAANGGVGPGVSPKTAFAVGLKVDVEALPRKLRNELRKGRVNLDDPATTRSGCLQLRKPTWSST